MKVMHKTDTLYPIPVISLILPLLIFSASLSTWSEAAAVEAPESLKGLYIPASVFRGRSFEEIVHYLETAKLNLAVLHAKDPRGRLFWKSDNALANEIKAVSTNTRLKTAVEILKKKGIWAAAKVDVFQDSLLVKGRPEIGVRNSVTKELWADKKGLHWANPYDRKVWEYIVDLCLELVSIGIDEIQFDYVRFPSDGDMDTVEYPVIIEDMSPAQCIGAFLAYAKSRLKPAGARISVDLFGMIAWKSEDFGVGQILEEIEPHVDVICPMLYPSHFPKNFLGMENPGDYPYEIMKQSLEEAKKRTELDIRPWVQGFWYTPEEIIAQLKGIEENEISSWTVWHPSGKYADTFQALSIHSGAPLPDPEFYPSLENLKSREDRILPGESQIVNFSNYKEGYTILSLDDSIKGKTNKYGTMIDVISTIDESIIDRILTRRSVSYSRWTSGHAKILHIINLMVEDLDLDFNRMEPTPIYIDWEGKNVFSLEIPAERWDRYLSCRRDLNPGIRR